MSETDIAATELPSAKLCNEAVGVFHHWADLQAAVDELMNNGFDRADISMLAGEKVVEGKLGHVYERVNELEDDPNAPRIAFVGRDSLTEGKASAIGTLGYVGAVAAVGAVVASGARLPGSCSGQPPAGAAGRRLAVCSPGGWAVAAPRTSRHRSTRAGCFCGCAHAALIARGGLPRS